MSTRVNSTMLRRLAVPHPRGSFRIIAGFGLPFLLLLQSALAVAPGSTQGSTQQLRPETVRIGVLSLFHPQELLLRTTSGSSLTMQMDDRPMEARGLGTAIAIRLRNGRLEIAPANAAGEHAVNAGSITGSIFSAQPQADGTHGAAQLLLEVPGKLRRTYAGTLEIRVKGQALEAIVTMPVETAVASIVQAESPPGLGTRWGEEALKAQAVATRSFLMARQTAHLDFDFCDTTHCQFLRSPAAAGGPADSATRATARLILTWHDDANARDATLAAMYGRSCGGRTRTLREIGLSSRGYPYYAVRCAYCSRHPELWRRDSQTPIQTERDRLAFNRIHGWGAMPSLAADGSISGKVNGKGTGHGLGLCQLGSADMARHGAGFAEILEHYYPNTRLTSIPRP